MPKPKQKTLTERYEKLAEKSLEETEFKITSDHKQVNFIDKIDRKRNIILYLGIHDIYQSLQRLHSIWLKYKTNVIHIKTKKEEMAGFDSDINKLVKAVEKNLKTRNIPFSDNTIRNHLTEDVKVDINLIFDNLYCQQQWYYQHTINKALFQKGNKKEKAEKLVTLNDAAEIEQNKDDFKIEHIESLPKPLSRKFRYIQEFFNNSKKANEYDKKTNLPDLSGRKDKDEEEEIHNTIKGITNHD